MWKLHYEVNGQRLNRSTSVDAVNAKLQNYKVDTALWKTELTFKNMRVENIIRFLKNMELMKEVVFDKKTMKEM